MKFPETLEEHLHQVVNDIIDKTTAELQELFRHHWKAIPGNSFWDLETGSELWRSCYTELKPTSKEKIVRGRISKWSIADLAVLLPELMRKNGNISLTIRYSEVLKHIQDLFAPLKTGSVVALSGEAFKRFMSSLSALLIQLDNDTMAPSSIIKDVISVEDLTQAVAALSELRGQTKIILLATEFLETFPNLPPYFEELIHKLRCHAQIGKIICGTKMMMESFELLRLDGSYLHAHANLADFYYANPRENPSLYFYHTRKHITLQTYRPYMFHFLKTFIEHQPSFQPFCIELFKGLVLMEKDTLPLTDHRLAMNTFQRAVQLGCPLGAYVYSLVAILFKDLEVEQLPPLAKSKLDPTTLQHSAQLLMKQVENNPFNVKYNSGRFENEMHALANFLVGYLYEKGLIPQDFDKAKALYRTAVTVHNSEIASYFLGSMYYDGIGVRKSYMWAKFYWQHSVLHTERVWPTYAIIDYYLKHLEHMYAETQSNFLKLIDSRTKTNKQVKCLIKRLDKFRNHNLAMELLTLRHQVVACEQTWNLSSKGLTLLERLKRVELLGFKHEFGAAIKQIYAFFKLSYGTEKKSNGDGGTMSEYVHGFDKTLEVDYSLLFSRIYLVAPMRIFTVTTFRHNLATDQQPKWKIKYNTRSYDEIAAFLPRCFGDISREQFTVIEDLLFTEDAVYLLLEDRRSGAIQHLKVTLMKTVMRTEKHLKLEYGALVTLSHLGGRSLIGNVNACFGDTIGPMMEVIVVGKETNFCRFCVDPIVNVKECICGARYCGQVCLDKDRKFLKHGFLCVAST